MTRVSRRILFIAAAVLFAAASYIVILYAQGYKYSFPEARFLRTGAIALKANTDAKVFVNDKLVGSTSFFTDAFSVSGLLPNQYAIRLQQDGYSLWQKRVSVQEGLLIDFPRALILPTGEEEIAPIIEAVKKALILAKMPAIAKPSISPTASASVQTVPAAPVAQDGPITLRGSRLLWKNGNETKQLSSTALGFALSENENRLLWWTSHELWVLWLQPTGHQPYHASGDTALITRFSSTIRRAAWYPDSDHIAADLGTLGYRIVEIDTRGGINIIKL